MCEACIAVCCGNLGTNNLGCDHRMLRYMSKVKWLDRIMNDKVRRRCEVENLEHRLRKMRLRWFGHVKRRNENSILRRAMEPEVELCRKPVGRSKKTWSKVVEEDMRKLTSQKIWQRRKCCLFSNICKWLDFHVFSDKDVKP